VVAPAVLQAMLAEFRLDYNQRHFVRNETFKKAAEGIEVRLPPAAAGAEVAIGCRCWR
jgi:hypothetical protein